MMFGLLDRRPLLEETYAGWMFEVFGWALRNFDPLMFRDETVLVTPSNEHFPGRANSTEEMANLIFGQVVSFAGMQHWPVRLLPPGSCVLDPESAIRVVGNMRGSRASSVVVPTGSLPISYDPGYINNPEAMIAVFSHALAHYLGTTATQPPPGGAENWPQVTEVLAVFLGFGLMFANTALMFPRGGCCGGPTVQRSAAISQHDITYTLAIFSALKGLPPKSVTRHLKKSLRGHFKQALREVEDVHGARLQSCQRLLLG
jgi:hypothetical protein